MKWKSSKGTSLKTSMLPAPHHSSLRNPQIISDLEFRGHPFADVVPPKGWIITNLAPLLLLVGSGFACGRNAQVKDGLIHLRPMNVSSAGRIDLTDLRFVPADAGSQRLRAGDVLFNNTNSPLWVGKTAVIEEKVEGLAFSNHMTQLRPNPNILDAQFLAWQLNWLRTEGYFSINCNKHVNQASISGSYLREKVPFLLPPLHEQQRIVSRLLELTARSRDARSILEELLAPLVQARQAILASAFRGDLTVKWRHSAIENTSIIEKVTELGAQRMRVAKTLRQRNDLEEIYSKIEVSPRNRIPNSWSYFSLAKICYGFDYGTSAKSSKRGTTPVIRMGNIQNGEVDWDELVFTSDPREIEQYLLAPGTVLFNRTNSPELVGKTAIYKGERPAVFAGYLIRIRHSELLLPEYLNYWLNSSEARDLCVQAKSDGVNQSNINASKLASFELPLAPILEQHEIVKRLNQSLRRIQVATAARTTAMMELDRLDQILFAKAFSGKLATQNRDDEPALSALNSLISVNKSDLPTDHLESAQKKKSRRPPVNKTSHTRRTWFEVPNSQITDFKLRSLKLEGRYGSLCDFSQLLRPTDPKFLSPICLVGSNGSGKSNVLEAVSEVFSYLELSNIPWEKLPVKWESSLNFEVCYSAKFKGKKTREFRVAKKSKHAANYYEVKSDGSEVEISDRQEQLSILPRRVIGYSSGLNETLSIPFFKTKALYAREVREAAKGNVSRRVSDTRTLFMDYESNAAILLTNFLFAPVSKLKLFGGYIRVAAVESFKIRFNLKPPGRNITVKLTTQLRDHLRRLASCAGKTFNPKAREQSFEFGKADLHRQAFAKAFPGGSSEFFLAIYRLSLLNALSLTKTQRELYEKRDPRVGIVERPPSVPNSDRVFSIEDLKLRLTTPDVVVPYAGLSDGEHQFIQIFGTIMLFNEPGILFLLDEPESHFNPDWRTQFVKILEDVGNAYHQEVCLSTHSPFIVSGCRGEFVFKFERENDSIKCTPAGFETYGSSFDYLLSRLFKMEALISEKPLNELKKVVKSGNLKDLEAAVTTFGESFEKSFLFQQIANKEAKARKRRRKR